MIDEDGTLRYERYEGRDMSYRSIRLFYRKFYNANRNIKKDTTSKVSQEKTPEYATDSIEITPYNY